MALDASLLALCARLEALRETLAGLRVTVVEDRPLGGESILAESLGDLAEELLAGADEALAPARRALAGAAAQGEGRETIAALAASGELALALLVRFFCDLAAYERLAEVARLGRARGGEWRAWAGTVRQGAEGCRQPLFEACAALAAAWRELAERCAQGGFPRNENEPRESALARR